MARYKAKYRGQRALLRGSAPGTADLVRATYLCLAGKRKTIFYSCFRISLGLRNLSRSIGLVALML